MFLFRLKKLWLIIRNPFLISALLKGVAAGVEHRIVLQGLNCEYIVDVGANRGQFALISRSVFPRAKIHSFEPLEEPAQIFKSVFGNDSNVMLHACAESGGLLIDADLDELTQALERSDAWMLEERRARGA